MENGDRLTREEFHRRYEAMPENVKAELIKGVVYMASPVRVNKHAIPHARVMSFLGNYQMNSRAAQLLDNPTFIASEEYEPQPDGVLMVREDYGGNAWINDKDYLEGSPELVVEVSSSSASYDLHDKFEMYEHKRVQEYIVWRVLDSQIDWFQLVGEKYKRLSSDENGILESKVFPGLRLNVNALLEDDMPTVSADLKIGMESKRYFDFAELLEKHRASR